MERNTQAVVQHLIYCFCGEGGKFQQKGAIGAEVTFVSKALGGDHKNTNAQLCWLWALEKLSC